MSSSNLVRLAYKKETDYGVTPAAVKASKVLQDITYTAKKGGAPGNSLQIEYTTGGTAGAEVVTVTGNKISIKIQSGTSTATQVLAAFNGSSPALALATAAITGTGSTTQVSAAAVNFTGGSGEANTARFTQEKYSGTPQTAQSNQIRTDRQSSGQVVTGLQVNGGHNFELAKEAAIEDFFSSAMLNPWTNLAQITRALTIDVDAQTITAVAGDFRNEGLAVGDFIVLVGFTDTVNNTVVMITSISQLVLGFNGPATMVDGTGGSTKYQRADKLVIGQEKISFTIEKTFLDLTDKAIIYRGCLVSQMEIDVEYGQFITGSFDTQGNDYDPVEDPDDFVTADEYIDDPATSETLNGSVDMPFISTDVTGSFETGSFCLQSLKLTLNNNLQVQTCIGKAAPEDYSPGTAAITVALSSYLKDGTWDMLERKLTQESFALGFMVQNVDGWYAFYIPAIQVSFDDPSSKGANQQVSMDMSGTAKVGANGESALAIFRLPAA